MSETTDLKIDLGTDSLSLYRHASGYQLLTQNVPRNARPFIHPITAPGGQGVLTEDAPAHHPWQHGLYVGLKRVNGVGFWEESLRGKPTDGTFDPVSLQVTLQGASRVGWQVVTDWRAPDRSALLRETQAWQFQDRGEHYLLDLSWTLAAQASLEIEQAAYGGLFLRMPFNEALGGQVVTSEGKSDLAADAERARWLSVSMMLHDLSRPVTVTLMDAPSNPNHPSPWRVDGELGVSPSRCISGAWHVAEGASANHTYRLLIHLGEPDPTLNEAVFSEFARETA